MNSIKKKIMESENTLGLPEGIHSSHSSEAVGLYEVNGTPVAVFREDEMYWTGLGKYRLSEPFDNIEDAGKDAQRTDLNRLVQLMAVVAKIEIEQNKHDVELKKGK